MNWGEVAVLAVAVAVSCTGNLYLRWATGRLYKLAQEECRRADEKRALAEKRAIALAEGLELYNYGAREEAHELWREARISMTVG
jgi:hypothetical protein